MKIVCIVAGILLMGIGLVMTFTLTHHLDIGSFMVPASALTIFGYLLYRKGKEL